jgi:eukaryotic-like serine/threonine-protein kinase
MIEPETIIDGRYRVLSRIGSGGMAEVYLAQDRLLGREVAVKLLHHRFAEDQEFVERFHREASSAAGLSHPNVVGIFDRGEWNGTYYIAMEYVPGRSLKAMVRERGALDPTGAVEIVIQILRAARFAHQRGIIHRDLKPHNVILDDEGRAKVTDFGIARAGASDMTLTGSIMGTAQYLSPEQAQGQAVSASSDLYAVGIVLYELLTGSVPFDGETAVTIALKQVSAEPSPPSALNPAVSVALDAVVLRALAKDPAQRFLDAEQFIEALRHATRAPDSAPPGTDGIVRPPGALLLPAAGPLAGEPDPTARRRRWMWAGVAVVLLALALGAVWVLMGARDRVTVPNVAGQPQALAVSRLKRAGLTPATSSAQSATVVDGTVISQRPAHGSVVKEGSRVSLLVSSGPGSLALASVNGLTSAQALRALRAEGYTPTTQTQSSDTVAQGRVISTDPPAGTELQLGSPVTVLVSSGAAQVRVPDLTGQSQAEAAATLAAAGLKVGSITPQVSTGREPGVVLSQSPAAGASLQAAQKVNLVVAKAPKDVAVPDVTGRSETEAVAAIARAGLTPKTVSRPISDPTQAEQVLKQSPAGGHRARRGATVRITVGVLEQQTQTTTTTSSTPQSTSTTTTTTSTTAPPAG